MKFFRFSLTLALLSVALMSSAFGAWDPNELPPGFVVEKPGFPVELDGNPLFYLQVKHKALSTEKRARTFSEQIKKLAEDPTFNPKTIRVEDSLLSSDIMAGDKILMPGWAFEAKVISRTNSTKPGWRSCPPSTPRSGMAIGPPFRRHICPRTINHRPFASPLPTAPGKKIKESCRPGCPAPALRY